MEQNGKFRDISKHTLNKRYNKMTFQISGERFII